MAESDFRIGGTQQNAETGEIPAMEISGINPSELEPTPTEPQEPAAEPTPTEPVAAEPQVETPQHPTPTGTPPPDLEKPTAAQQPAEPQEPAPQEPAPVEPVVQEPAPVEPVAEPVQAPKLDPEVQRLQNFLAENEGKTIQDYMAINRDWEQVSDIDVIKNQIKNENAGVTLNDEQLTLLAGKKLGVDLTDGVDELYEADALSLKLEAAKARQQFQQEKEKYNTTESTETPSEPTPTQADVEMVTLMNGQQMEKAVYEQARTKYTTEVKDVVAKLDKESFSFDTGSGDKKQTIVVDYIIEDSDRHDVLNELMNVPPAVLEKHVDAQGNLDINNLTKDVLYSNPQRTKKMMQRAISQAHAKGIEEVLKQESNINFDTARAEKTVNPNKPIVDSRDDVVTVKLHGF